MTLDSIADAMKPHGLFVMGHSDGRVLIGTDRGWWGIFTQSNEFNDGSPDPIDRWSKRIIGAAALSLGATCAFPSDGPPFSPFIAWALATGRFWQSPTGMMVHDYAGLMISIRGALKFETPFPEEPAGQSPCEACTDKPCVNACPVDALSATHAYDVPVCKTYLETPAGNQCMTRGCHVRLACPISQKFDRPHNQTAFHMKAFRG